MNFPAFFAIGIGAALGAWVRFGLALWLNPLFSNVPLGTLVANLSGGYLVGVAVAVADIHSDFPAEAKLFFVTGFLGALTTFSTFSAEVVSLLQRADYGWALAAAGLHLCGSLAMTALGIYSVQMLAR